MADDGLYTKRVARRMLQMTRHINKDWKAHVGATGVTCYTCHRGQPVPANVWFNGVSAETQAVSRRTTTASAIRPPSTARRDAELRSRSPATFAAKDVDPRPGDAGAAARLRRADPGDGTDLCADDRACRRASASTAPSATTRALSDNGRRARRSASPPGTASQMVRDLNTNYLDPLKSELPANRLGPTGDGPKLVLRHLPSGRAASRCSASAWPRTGRNWVALRRRPDLRAGG